MKIMIIGSGGREHALAYTLAKSPGTSAVYVSPGNPGIGQEPKCHNLPADNEAELIRFALEERIDLIVIGPEGPLVDGLADRFRAAGLSVFGPGAAEAMLEGSKSFAKAFMQRYGIATARYETFSSYDAAAACLKANTAYPVVIKASGLCAGKGVVIAENLSEGLEALSAIMLDKVFQDAGDTVVIEEFLQGKETSILSIFDGEKILPLASAMDHKKIFDGEMGPNTGGMGTISPSPHFTPEAEADFLENILNPTLQGMSAEGFTDPACIFFGLMITQSGVRLLEYNMRFGDPETQVVLMRLETDLAELLQAAAHGRLPNEPLRFNEQTALCVIGAAPGYPGPYQTGIPLTFPPEAGIKVFFAGIKDDGGELKSSGGRIFGITAMGGDPEAVRAAIAAYFKAHIPPAIVYRKDIGRI